MSTAGLSLLERACRRGRKWGVGSLRSCLMQCDRDKDGAVSIHEIAEGLTKYGISPTRGVPAAEVMQVLGLTSTTQYVAIDDFIELMQLSYGPLSTHHDHEVHAEIHRAFAHVCSIAGTSRPTVMNLCRLVDLSPHPDVESGAAQYKDALLLFFTMWCVPPSAVHKAVGDSIGGCAPCVGPGSSGGAGGGYQVSEQEFLDFHLRMAVGYYANKATEFRHLIRGMWRVPTRKSTAADSGKYKIKSLPYPSPQEREKLFLAVDTNRNGVLSLAELDLAVIRQWPQLNNKPAILRAFKLADSNGSGRLGKTEFAKFLRYVVAYNEMWLRFKAVDVNDDRRLSFDEMRRNKAVLGLESLSANELKAVFRQMDKNGGGQVLFDEFCIFFAKRFGDEAMQADTMQR